MMVNTRKASTSSSSTGETNKNALSDVKAKTSVDQTALPFVPENGFQKFVAQRLVNVQSQLSVIDEQYKELKKTVDVLKETIIENKNEIDMLKKSLSAAHDLINEQERRSRRFNLRFTGVPENNDENCVLIMQDLLEKVGVTVKLSTAHRLGKKDSNRSSRHMIVKVSHLVDRDAIFRQMKTLKDKFKVSVFEDLSRRDYAVKKSFGSIIKDARLAGKRVRFVNGKLYIDGILYNNS